MPILPQDYYGPPRRWAIVNLPQDEFIPLIQGRIRWNTDLLPADAKVLTVRENFATHSFSVLLESETFEIVPFGENAPTIGGVSWFREWLPQTDKTNEPKLWTDARNLRTLDLAQSQREHKAEQPDASNARCPLCGGDAVPCSHGRWSQIIVGNYVIDFQARAINGVGDTPFCLSCYAEGFMQAAEAHEVLREVGE